MLKGLSVLQTQFQLSHPVQKKLKIERLEAAKISIALGQRGFGMKKGLGSKVMVSLFYPFIYLFIPQLPIKHPLCAVGKLDYSLKGS